MQGAESSGPGQVLDLQACFEKSLVFPLSRRTCAQHMADQKHSASPSPLVFLPLCTAPLHEVGHRHKLTICQRSLALPGFTFLRRGAALPPSHTRRATRGVLWTNLDIKLMSVNDPSNWRAGWQPCQQMLWGWLFRPTSIQSHFHSQKEHSCCALEL